MINLLKPVPNKDLIKIIVWIFIEILNIGFDSIHKNSERKFNVCLATNPIKLQLIKRYIILVYTT